MYGPSPTFVSYINVTIYYNDYSFISLVTVYRTVRYLYIIFYNSIKTMGCHWFLILLASFPLVDLIISIALLIH